MFTLNYLNLNSVVFILNITVLNYQEINSCTDPKIRIF